MENEAKDIGKLMGDIFVKELDIACNQLKSQVLKSYIESLDRMESELNKLKDTLK
jgi:uncharacterized protein (UPF0335 family)